MSSDNQVPCIHFSHHHHHNEIEKCNEVREALESHGCFLLLIEDDNQIVKMKTQMLRGMKELFDLPQETKNKYVNPRPYQSYSTNNLLESFGIDTHPLHLSFQDFTHLLWPHPNPNPSFSESLKCMSMKMEELNNSILRMVLKSYGVEKLWDEFMEDTTSAFRLMKYKAPESNETSAMGLVAHTDKNTLTILSQNDVQGLEILNHDGIWVSVTIPVHGFIVIAADALQAWSNGRIEAARHRVVMKGKKERYTFGLFSMPKEGAIIQVPNELVDIHHPLLYRPFIFSDFYYNFVNNIREHALQDFAGL